MEFRTTQPSFFVTPHKGVINITKTSKKNYNILQITDTHLFSDDGGELFDVKPNLLFRKCVDYAIQLKFNPDFIFLTGDLSQDKSLNSYQTIADELSRFNIPIYWIPGNHDDINAMKNVFDGCSSFSNETTLLLDNMMFIFINTKYKCLDSGFFYEESRSLIENTILKLNPATHICLIMHHNPIQVGTPLIDKHMLENHDDFWHFLNKYKQIKHIIFGHVHGDYLLKKRHVTLESAPATCVQFKKGARTLDLDHRVGFKIHHMKQNVITSTVKYLKDFAC